MALRGKGIHYDTGFFPGGVSTRDVFDPAVVGREMQIIAGDLHCTAVRISGGDPDRLTVAAEHAAAAGLEVWFSPFPCDMTPADMLPYFAECAGRAERIRRAGAEVVLVTGCEVSLFATGFIPGGNFPGRMAVLSGPDEARIAALRDVPVAVNRWLAQVVATVRPRFGGRITYASIPMEHVDWRPFDIVGVDAYRSEANAATYRQRLGLFLASGRPVAVTEVGCCTYHGAGDRGASGWLVIGPDGHLTPGLVRDEGEQVRYLDELLPIFEEEGIDSVFWFTFAGYTLPHRPEPGTDLDLASYGIVKMVEGGGGTYPDLGWEPKEAFHRLAARYALA